MVRQQTERLNLTFAANSEGRGVLSSARTETAVLAKTKFVLISLLISCIPLFTISTPNKIEVLNPLAMLGKKKKKKTRHCLHISNKP